MLSPDARLSVCEQKAARPAGAFDKHRVFGHPKMDCFGLVFGAGVVQ